MEEKVVLIIGGGIAGLSAAYVLLTEGKGFKPIVIEVDDVVGGLSKTLNYDGNLIDIGPHRFFSKDQRVMNFWKSLWIRKSSTICAMSMVLTIPKHISVLKEIIKI